MDLDAVKINYGKCSIKPDFFDRFYEHFLASHPNFKPMFANTDFSKQKELLKNSITYMIMFATGSGFAKGEIDRISVIHDDKHFNVKPEYYPFWVDALIKTLKEFDPEFSSELEQSWREVTQLGINSFIEKHRAA